MRADARANRAAILDAARELYALRGPEVPFSAIAERAGVGTGTLYRHFPTQQDLAMGIVGWLADRVDAVCERWVDPMTADPAGAWRGFVTDLVDLQVAAFMPRVVEGIDITELVPEITQRRTRALAAIDEVLRPAKGAGLVRADVTAEQFQLGLAVVTRPLPPASAAFVPDLGDWLVEVFVRGVRPD